MKFTVFLVFDSYGLARARKNKGLIKNHEIEVCLDVTLPDNIFQIPKFSESIEFTKEQISKPIIEPKPDYNLIEPDDRLG